MPVAAKLLVLVLALGAVACTRFADVGADRVGTGYVTGGGEWSSGGGITIAARAFERNGETVICGAWATDPQSALTANLNDDVLAAGSVYLGRTRAAHDLGFMARVGYRPDLTGARANCIAAGLPWRPEYAETGPLVRLPDMSFPVSRLPKHLVTFRQAARPEAVH